MDIDFQSKAKVASYPFLGPLRLMFFYFSALPLLIAIILFFAIDDTAITESNWSPTHADIQRAKSIVINSKSKNRKRIRLSEKDLNITLSHLLNYYIPSNSQITVRENQLQLKISLLLNKNDFGKYLNFSFKLTKEHGYPTITSLQIGEIKIADEFTKLILKYIIEYPPFKEHYILVTKHILKIQLEQKGLTIVYIAPAKLDLKTKLSLSNKNHQSVIFYQQQITNIVAQHDPKWRLSLAKLLQPLLKLAYQRSAHTHAVAENRAVLIAVNTYVNKKKIQAYLPFDISPSTVQQYQASLYRRTDIAKHFMISAVLAATGTETLAYLLGQEKELDDAKQGSGFSFIDLASDRAGLQFGKTAVASESKARTLQKRMLQIKDYTAFMPDVRDLPENMDESAFKQEFESVYSVDFQNILEKIDQRISALPIYN